MSIYHFPVRLLIENKKQRIRVIVEPNLDSNVLKQVSISSQKLYLTISKLNDFIVRAVNKWVELYFVLQ